MDSLKPIHFLYMGPFSGNVSTGLMSLVVNIVVVGLITLVKPAASADYAKPEDRPYAASNRPTLH
jgi:SSS family solute:Na+ symporter